ncbi:MAG: CDP-alcohol phosphatidyltransferase family protein [Alphaproteobacteria bacterium]|nr:CDP-alcohol phosphatidyltransferase family protein [Alphaproteobacteria bacterium]
MLRSLTLADAFTIANATCGTLSIFVCLQWLDEGRVPLWAAFALLPTAFVLDALDGRIARWTRRSSTLGGDLDSLADVISFGVAPAVLGFTLGLRGGWDSLVLAYFVVCGVARLARYNATSAALSDEAGKVRYFEGTPIPTSLVLVAVLGVAVLTGNAGHHRLWGGVMRLGPATFHPLVLMYAASGTAMVSARLRIPKP